MKEVPQKPSSSGGATSIVKISNPVPVQDISRMSALMFWIELVKPGGEKERTTTDRIFHNGERFQLHVESNVTGRLVIYQRNPHERDHVLFPNPTVYAGDNLVEAKVDTVVPSAGKIKFDNTPATETLFLVLTPAKGQLPGGISAGPVASKDVIQIAQRSVETASDRGLVVEADTQPGAQAEYAASTGPVAIEIKLRHQ